MDLLGWKKLCLDEKEGWRERGVTALRAKLPLRPVPRIGLNFNFWHTAGELLDYSECSTNLSAWRNVSWRLITRAIEFLGRWLASRWIFARSRSAIPKLLWTTYSFNILVTVRFEIRPDRVEMFLLLSNIG